MRITETVNVFRTIANQRKQAMPADSGIMPDLRRLPEKDTFTKAVNNEVIK